MDVGSGTIEGRYFNKIAADIFGDTKEARHLIEYSNGSKHCTDISRHQREAEYDTVEILTAVWKK